MSRKNPVTPDPAAPGRPASTPGTEPVGSRRGWMRWECSVIGSADGVSLQLRSALVDPLHCAIMRVAGGFEIWDLNSRGGTFLNDMRVMRAPLAEGDRIRIGPYKMRFVGEPGAAGAAPKKPVTGAGSSRALPVRLCRPAPFRTPSGVHVKTPSGVHAPSIGVPRAPAETPHKSPDSSGLVNTLDPVPPTMKSDAFDTADLLFASLGQPDVQAEIIALRRQVAEQKQLISRLVGGPEVPAKASAANPVQGFVDIEQQLRALGGDDPAASADAPPADKP